MNRPTASSAQSQRNKNTIIIAPEIRYLPPLFITISSVEPVRNRIIPATIKSDRVQGNLNNKGIISITPVINPIRTILFFRMFLLINKFTS